MSGRGLPLSLFPIFFPFFRNFLHPTCPIGKISGLYKTLENPFGLSIEQRNECNRQLLASNLGSTLQQQESRRAKTGALPKLKNRIAYLRSFSQFLGIHRFP